MRQVFRNITLTLLLSVSTTAIAEPNSPVNNLSPELLELLRAEMRALQTDIQTLPLHIAAADWNSIAKVGDNISASYILKQRLTRKQMHELHTALPENFQQIDAAFHLQAKKLADAARSRDAELVSFHFYRLVDACAGCHAKYASERFPGFENGHEHKHSH